MSAHVHPFIKDTETWHTLSLPPRSHYKTNALQFQNGRTHPVGGLIGFCIRYVESTRFDVCFCVQKQTVVGFSVCLLHRHGITQTVYPNKKALMHKGLTLRALAWKLQIHFCGKRALFLIRAITVCFVLLFVRCFFFNFGMRGKIWKLAARKNWGWLDNYLDLI